uniref:QacG n=6 Tax=Pseudomonadota TaxID=1224 RepID=A0A386JBK7_CITFR|nr:QacG [Citrobacter freundii]
MRSRNWSRTLTERSGGNGAVAVFMACYDCFFVQSMPRASKQQARYAVGRCLMLWSSNDVTQQGSRPKTKLDALLCAQISASNKTVFFLKSNLKFLRGTPWRNILKNWLFLATAIIFEVIATSALKSSEGFTRLVPSFIVVAGYAAAFYFLSLTLKSIPVGIAYAVWSGLGIVLVTAIAWVLHGQKLDMWGFVGVGFIISGVAVLNLLSKASVH